MIAFQNCINIGGRIKRVVQGLEGGKKMFLNFDYMYFQEIKKYYMHFMSVLT